MSPLGPFLTFAHFVKFVWKLLALTQKQLLVRSPPLAPRIPKLLPQATHVFRSTIHWENGKPQVRPCQGQLLQRASLLGGQSP